jgi:hypothetical protein
VLTTAIDDWAAAGLPGQDIARLRGVTVQITNLPAGYLGGTAIGGSTIYLSADAGGYGWFTDPSPWNNAALARPVAATEFVAMPAAAPAGHEDLLTVVMHELGHTLGLYDLDPNTSPDDLMAETLATGVRRLPSAEDVATVVAAQAVPPRTTASVPTSNALVDALIEVAYEHAIGLLPAPTIEQALRVDRGAASKQTSSRRSRAKEPQETGSHGRRLVVTYRPEVSTGGTRRISDVAL